MNELQRFKSELKENKSNVLYQLLLFLCEPELPRVGSFLVTLYQVLFQVDNPSKQEIYIKILN